jgi:hypothetical protein
MGAFRSVLWSNHHRSATRAINRALRLSRKILRFPSYAFHSGPRGYQRDLVIVTGADSSHFMSALQFLESALQQEPDADAIFWDLGLTDLESEELHDRFPTVIMKNFPFSAYPTYFAIEKNSGEYAWKPVAIELTALAYTSGNSQPIIVWCDAGNLLRRRLSWVRMFTAGRGIYAPISPESVATWTHNKTLDQFALTPRQLNRDNTAAGLVSFDLSKTASVDIMILWSTLAQTRALIAPPGSNRSNHRQDQSILSCINVVKSPTRLI